MNQARPDALVTGGQGFIGRALLYRFQELAWPVIGVSRCTSTVDYIRTGPALNAKADWRPLLNGRTIVVHTAARVHVMRDSVADPLAAYREINVDGTLNLAQQAAESGVRRFVFISSIKVNGELTMSGQPFMADDSPNPKDPYAISKAEAEAALLRLAIETNMEVVIIRPPLVYGPGVGANFLRMMHWLKRGTPLPLGAVRNNLRTLVGLDNLVDLVVTCMKHPAAANQVFLAGDDVAVSTADLLRRLSRVLGVPARLIPVPVWMLEAGAALVSKSAEMQRLCGNLQVDISKAQEKLGWKPLVNLDEGLRRTALWYRDNGRI